MHRDVDPTAILAQARQKIAEHGWTVIAVEPCGNDTGPSFAYTAGLTAAGLPEIVIGGLPPELTYGICNDAARLSTKTELTPGATIPAGQIARVELKVIAAPAAPISLAERLYGKHRVRAIQLVWPDKHGFYPSDALWSLGDMQPIYALNPGQT